MKPVKTALCSFGMSGKIFHAPFIHLHKGFDLYAVLERNKSEAETGYPEIRTFRSITSLLNDQSIELLIVNTPNATHYQYAKMGLEMGKHVLVEKPFTTTVGEAEELIGLAKEQNKILTVYHNRRWDSDFKTVQDVIGKKLLGDVVEAEFHFDRYKKDLNPKLHKELTGPGSGILYDLGSHLIDQAIQLFGMPVKVFGDTAMIRPFSKVDDYMELILYYNDNLRVRLKGSYLVKEPLPAYILHGTMGSFIKSRGDVQETALKLAKNLSDKDWGSEAETGMGLLHTEIAGEVSRKYIPSLKGDYMEYYNLLYNAIRNDGAVPVTGYQGMLVIKIIEAAYKSVAENRVVSL